MKHNKFDKEYYAMDVDYNYPMLNWGATRSSKIGFGKPQPIDTSTLELPLQIIFDDNPKEYEMADFHILGVYYASNDKLKKIFEQLNIYGIQFIPAEIKHKNSDMVKGYYAIQVWNILPAVDKNNYEGGEINQFERINDLEKFSLDAKLLDGIPLKKRLFFCLHEKNLLIIHQSIYEALQKEKLTGVKFIRIDEWYSDWMLR